MLPLTQQHELELREPSAAGAATLLHALGHGWAWEADVGICCVVAEGALRSVV